MILASSNAETQKII